VQQGAGGRRSGHACMLPPGGVGWGWGGVAGGVAQGSLAGAAGKLRCGRRTELLRHVVALLSGALDVGGGADDSAGAANQQAARGRRVCV
jgi:hypothetical protein